METLGSGFAKPVQGGLDPSRGTGDDFARSLLEDMAASVLWPGAVESNNRPIYQAHLLGQ